MTDIDYRAMWREELANPISGQHADRLSTWTLDNLWKAACYQYQRDDAERSLADVMDAGLSPETIEKFLKRYDDLCATCHHVFLHGEPPREEECDLAA